MVQNSLLGVFKFFEGSLFSTASDAQAASDFFTYKASGSNGANRFMMFLNRPLHDRGPYQPSFL